MLALGVILMPWLRTFEDQLVYHPSRAIVATPDDYGLSYASLELSTDDNVRIHAWAIPASDDAPWLVYFHGNGQNISHYLDFTRRLHDYGLNILMPEYRGYGRSEGTPSEEGLYKDALAAYAYLQEQGVPPERIALYGFSLGSGVAVDLAQQQEVAAVILEAPYTSLPDVARDVYRIVPRFLVRNRFDSLAKIGRVNAPLLIMHARPDRVVPFRHGLKLYEAANEPKVFLELSGHHAGLLGDAPPQEALDAIMGFLYTHLP
jgi:fermentation-respiration switch protein FrsA (DUF1100 family)